MGIVCFFANGIFFVGVDWCANMSSVMKNASGERICVSFSLFVGAFIFVRMSRRSPRFAMVA